MFSQRFSGKSKKWLDWAFVKSCPAAGPLGHGSKNKLNARRPGFGEKSSFEIE